MAYAHLNGKLDLRSASFAVGFAENATQSLRDLSFVMRICECALIEGLICIRTMK
jgi:hypothetical protein